ncbi:hypothetical protein F7725_021654 [Dissostichus mawsoni]|uniref:C1q domain-containing protein n=1 Tax=Dissostichus mawsoni TaxID=36200 RepID=A0A7J5ZBT8_DISMA|nr:hypothetical protein F7725_021654 [Dissostichus mawsoni]
MMQQMATVQANLNAYKTQAEDLIKINLAQDEKLKALVDASSAVTAKMAFTAALGSTAGPVEKDMPLKYQRILSNIGSGYNPATGIFTAMVRGMYYFSYTMYNNNSGQPNSVLSLMMNTQKIVSTWDMEGEDSHDSATNAAVVQLEGRQRVRAALRKQSPLRRRLLLQHLQWLPALHLVPHPDGGLVALDAVDGEPGGQVQQALQNLLVQLQSAGPGSADQIQPTKEIRASYWLERSLSACLRMREFVWKDGISDVRVTAGLMDKEYRVRPCRDDPLIKLRNGPDISATHRTPGQRVARSVCCHGV